MNSLYTASPHKENNDSGDTHRVTALADLITQSFNENQIQTNAAVVYKMLQFQSRTKKAYSHA
jgi:hypothetical protein